VTAGGIEARLGSLRPGDLAPVARAALGREDAEVAEWRWEPLRPSLGFATGGLFRVRGTARVRGTVVPWSAVLKALRAPRGTLRDAVAREPEHFAYWKREALAYGSGLLADLPGVLAAPRCLGQEAPPDAGEEAVWLWLEEVADRYQGWWPPRRTLLAARHLGAFNGAYAAGRRPLPVVPWLGRGYLRQRVEGGSESLPLFETEAAFDHPLLRGHFDPGTAGRLSRLWARRRVLLDALDRVQPTLCHGDCHQGNLFAPPVSDGVERTVAVDWGTAGIGPLGADLAELALSRAVAGELLAPGGAGFGDRLCGHYLRGLRDAGWAGESETARLGYAATAALAGASRLHWTLERNPDEDVIRRWSALTRCFLTLADEVNHLSLTVSRSPGDAAPR
jgi:hypothetical protein